jgi:hypothetical protein
VRSFAPSPRSIANPRSPRNSRDRLCPSSLPKTTHAFDEVNWPRMMSSKPSPFTSPAQLTEKAASAESS